MLFTAYACNAQQRREGEVQKRFCANSKTATQFFLSHSFFTEMVRQRAKMTEKSRSVARP
jgi:hypothetical protein